MNIKFLLKRIAEIPTKVQFQEWEKKLSHIGDLTTLKTNAKNNLVEAINEIMDSIFVSGADAIDVHYDDSISKLGVTNVQDAIFALDQRSKELEKTILSVQSNVGIQTNRLNTLNSDLASQTGIPLTTTSDNTIASKEEVVMAANTNSLSQDNSKIIRLTAAEVKYSDTNTSLGAVNVQKAIELLVEKNNLLESLIRATDNEITTQTNRLAAINAELSTLSKNNV